MGRVVHARGTMSALAGAFLLLSGPAALAAACDTQEEALGQYRGLVQAARARIEADSEPPVLQKDKIGLVLVARAATSRPLDEEALRRDIDALRQQFARSPGDVCRAVEQIRQTHGL